MAALTSLRFFTAAHVFFFHLYSARILFQPAPARLLVSIGYVGVNWFFVLSGFILTYSYAGRSFAQKSFWRARLARVYPAYAVSLFLAAPFFIHFCFHPPMSPEPGWMAVMRDHVFSFVVLDLVLMQSWIPAAALSFNPVGWSLSVEAFFYFLFPLILYRVSSLSRRKLICVLLGCGIASVAMSSSYLMFSPDGVERVTPDMNHLFWLNFIRFNPLVRLPEFLVGVCGALLYFGCPLAPRKATLLVAGGLLAFAAVTFFSREIPYPVIHNGLLSLPFLAIILGVANRPSWVAILEWRIFTGLGEISYSFFLTHGIVIYLFFGKTGGAPRLHSMFEILSCLVVSVVLAWGLYLGVEQPLRRRFSISRTKPQTTGKVPNAN